MDFQFTDTVRTIDIKDVNGEVIKTFSVDVGNIDFLEKCLEKSDSMMKTQEEHGKQASPETLKRLLDDIKAVIEMVLGDGSWEWFWEQANHNIIPCIKFSRQLSEFVMKESAEMQKGYV